jgi:translin
MLEKISALIRENFEAKDNVREEGLKISREIVRECKIATYALHNQDFEKADRKIKTAKDELEKLESLFGGHADIYYAGFVEHAQQEYTEVSVLNSMIRDGKGLENIPSPEELRVGYTAYLNGLGDLVGELRRHVLDLIRKESFDKAEEFLEIMEDIHSILIDFDYPDAITRGLRRKTDVSRALIEKTRGDVVNSLGYKKLKSEMNNLEAKLATDSALQQKINK